MTSKNTPTNGKKRTGVRSNKIVITNPMLVDMVREKEKLVLEGREESKELERITNRIEELKEIEREHTGKVEVPDLLEKGKALQDEINAKINELEEISKEIQKIKLEAIPKDIYDEHMQLNKDKEAQEKKLNKIGLKIEKIKSKYIPKLQKLARKELTNEFEDLETSELVGDSIVIKTFNHLDEWKEKFREKNKFKI